MTEQKQIEEMAKDICKLGKPCEECSAYPDACKAVKPMRDRLIEVIGNKPFTSEYENYNSVEWAEHFADHLLANGVIVPPCKVGDVVKARDVFYKVYSVAYQDRDDFKTPNWRFHASPLNDDIDIDDIYFWLEEIEEETVCVCTREEAEKALKGGAEG